MDDDRGSGDVEVDAFVEVNLVSFAAWDLIVYLHSNPDAESTIVGLCTALARPEIDVAPALERCLATGVAVVHVGEDGVARYRLTQDRAVLHRVTRFVELASVRHVRLQLVRHVLGRASG